jgi:hypothetical protein
MTDVADVTCTIMCVIAAGHRRASLGCRHGSDKMHLNLRKDVVAHAGESQELQLIEIRLNTYLVTDTS